MAIAILQVINSMSIMRDIMALHEECRISEESDSEKDIKASLMFTEYFTAKN